MMYSKIPYSRRETDTESFAIYIIRKVIFVFLKYSISQYNLKHQIKSNCAAIDAPVHFTDNKITYKCTHKLKGLLLHMFASR